ncbi:hypothetical protein D623_10025586 [Myotis brandtii]|uniref:Cilia-and flagella-associated protein 54 n=1 Tax=Myotis brandtii TaxID=109478 RepID=S7NMM7_MYOBR|nr:hypothetical protein D623_10025586 [Myotis brandtii]
MAAHGRSSITSSSMSGISASQPGLPVPLLPVSATVSKTLQSKASSLDSLPNPTCHEDTLPLAVFYGPLDAKNPLLASLEKEIQELLGFIKRKEALSTTEEKKHEFNRRGAMSLFNIWTKYAPRLPTAYYNEKLLKVGDSLCEMKEYKLALLQCYGRYLQQFSISFDENIADIQQFKTVFFPNGTGDQTAANTFHALNGRNICSYQLVCNNDLNMQNKESVIQCLNILSSLRLTMQVALPQEHLCWIIFNGTVYIYTICRKLMVIGQSSKALEYLLWASVCMESSVPLLSIRYLTWRVTLYTAVCQCYYDCQAAIHGELPWPRTITERLLDEMFDSTASRFLAVLEALSDSNRRTLQTGPIVTDENVQPDKEIVVDMIMFLWQKCKLGIQRLNISRIDYSKFTQKISTNKWIYLLWQINEVIHCYKTEEIDIVVVAEVALRLSEILETLGNPKGKFKRTQETSLNKRTSELFGTPSDGREVLPILQKTPLEQLYLAYELLDKAIGGINVNRMLATLPNGLSVFDHCYAKYTQDTDGDISKPVTANSFMMDLHLELIQAQHQIAVVLLDQLEVLQIPTISKNISTKIPEKQKQPENSVCFTEVSVMNKIRKNKLSKAIYLMKKALLIFEKDATSTSSHNFLMEAYSLIEKVEVEQNAQYLYLKSMESSKEKKSRIPPPPILLSRTHCSVMLKPAPFISDVKVSWYRILGCKAEGSHGKVRLNNNRLPNSGEAIPADGKSIFEVKGLETNEKYVFAIAAYSSNGQLVGNAVGETTKPILIYSPLSTVTARMFLTQVAYQIGNYELAKKVFSPVWDYFVTSPPHNEQSVVCLSSMMTITQRRLHLEILAETSSILLSLFLRNIFVTSDIKIKEENLFCDNIKGNEIFPAQQIARLIECERVLVALELSNYLNDSSYALQSVTQCYGLLAPIIYHNIALVPVIQILIKCLVVLQGLPNVIHSKKHMASYESIQHMIACCLYYTTKILRSWKEYDLAVIIINYGKKMLDITSECKSLFGIINEPEETQEEGCSMKSSRTKRLQQTISPEKINEQLLLLETHLLKLTKQFATPELSGSEDPIFLYPIVLNWSVKGAVKEVMKFKQRPRFLEFFTQIMLKCINEEKFSLMVEITNPITDFLKRRNESLLGMKKIKHKDNIWGQKMDKSVKKYKAAVMEIGKTTEIPKRKCKKKGTLRDFLSKNPHVSELPERERNKRFDVRKIAHRFLVDNLNPLILNYIKKKRFRQMWLEEMPWRAQMNLYLANAHFNMLLIKLGERLKMKFGISHAMVSFRSCDPSIFSLYNSGTVLPTGKLTLENYKVMLDFLHTAKKRRINLPSDAEEFSIFIDSQMNDETDSKIQTANDPDFQGVLIAKEKDRAATLSLLDHFMKIFLHCRRAMVFAHRGGFWTLLQNCCRALWNYSQELQILLKQAVDLCKVFPISRDGFLSISVLPFYFGADLLIDMLIELQNTNSIEIIEEKGEYSVPSCYGNIKNDNGGSSLTFEHPLDNVNMVDLKWIHDFVLKSLELLYQVEKWETLVALAIQFNIISHERYTEQVTPLLVYAQRQLLLRIYKFEGPDIIQQPCVRYEAEYNEKITCRNFIGKQIKINSPPSQLIDTENDSDFLQKLILSEYSHAKGLLSVPVDVTDTLRCFRETLEKSRYHNRSIRHSRKLLSLFLAQTQGDKGINTRFAAGKVEFCLGTEEMHMPTPPDLSQEHFRVFSSVEKSKLPYSQLGLVISSYYETIDVLQASNQRSLKVQALHQLGSLLVFAGKKRAAFKCWCQALDDIFRKQDVLHTWKELGTTVTNATNSCSPPRSKDYSEEFLSRVGIWGCLQGAEISAKIAQFIKVLDVEKRSNCCILSALLFQGLLRTTLPHPKAERCYAQYEITQLLPGIELFSDIYRANICSVVASLYYVIRELHFAKQNIIIEVLTELSFFSEAFHEIFQIFCGKHMPSFIPTSSRACGKVKTFQLFDSGKPLTSKENIQALDDLINKGLPQILHTVGHQHLINKFSFVRAYLLVSVAATINYIPENILKTTHGYVSEKSKMNFPNLKDLYTKDDGGTFGFLKKLKDEFTLNTLKSILLTEAEDRLNSLVSEVEQASQKGLAQCSVGQLEIVVQARLQLAAIALQRHRAAYSVAIVFSTLKLLQDSKLFQKKEVQDDTESSLSLASVIEKKDDNEFLDPISLNSREYFSIHLWLTCRLALVTALVAQIRGIGIVKENDMTDYVSLINEVCLEAESAGDRELQAEFLMQAVIIGLQEKHLKADIITNLQAIIRLLEGSEFMSPRSYLTLARSLLLLDDLTSAEKFKELLHTKTEKLNLLTQSHNILIEQMLTFGETIEFPSSNTDYASPLQPLKNVYLPHIMLLAKTKMRIGHKVAKQVYYTSKKKDSLKWSPALQLFETSLNLCKISATEEYEVEAEILFQKGKIECQLLVEEKSPNLQLESLYEAIQISLSHDQNSGRHSSIKEPTVNRFEIYSSLAWIAIRAAAQVSKAVLAINLLIGKKNVRTDQVSQAALLSIPEFATVDLLSSYTDYLLDKYQVSFQTGYPFFYQTDDKPEDTDAIKKTPTKVDITWILLLRYYIHLQRINNMSKLLASPKPGSGISLPDDTLLTSLFNSGLILRQKEMHNFLKKFLLLYSSSCIDDFPRELFQELENQFCLEKFLFESSAKGHRGSSVHSILSLKLLSSQSTVESVSSDMAIQALNKELCFQWYIPPLERPPMEVEPMVLLLYAYNMKPLKISDVTCTSYSNASVGSFWVPLNRVIEIHEKLSNLMQIAEISLPAVPEVTPDENVSEAQEIEVKTIDKELELHILSRVLNCDNKNYQTLNDTNEILSTDNKSPNGSAISNS